MTTILVRATAKENHADSSANELAQVKEIGRNFGYFESENERKSNNDGSENSLRRCSEDLLH